MSYFKYLLPGSARLLGAYKRLRRTCSRQEFETCYKASEELGDNEWMTQDMQLGILIKLYRKAYEQGAEDGALKP